MKQWLALAALLFPLAANALEAGDFDRARGIIGILPLPHVLGDEPCSPYEPKDIPLFRTPGSPTPIGRIYVSRPMALHPEGGCSGPEVTVSITVPAERNESLPTLEFSYEIAGAIAVQREGEWFRIALNEGHAWVHVPDGARFLTLEQLLKDSLTHLRAEGQPALRDLPGAGKAIWFAGPGMQDDLPVEVLSLREVSGRTWVELRLLEVDVCTDEPTRQPPLTGWLPAHDASGLPAVWFSSRGC